MSGHGAVVVGDVRWKFFGDWDAAETSEALEAVFQGQGRPGIADERAGVGDELICDIKTVW